MPTLFNSWASCWSWSLVWSQHFSYSQVIWSLRSQLHFDRTDADSNLSVNDTNKGCRRRNHFFRNPSLPGLPFNPSSFPNFFSYYLCVRCFQIPRSPTSLACSSDSQWFIQLLFPSFSLASCQNGTRKASAVVLWLILHSEPKNELRAPAETETERGNELNARTINKKVHCECWETDMGRQMVLIKCRLYYVCMRTFTCCFEGIACVSGQTASVGTGILSWGKAAGAWFRPLAPVQCRG